MKIYLDDYEIEVIIVRKEIKNIYFRITDDLKLCVSCNNKCSTMYIKNLILSNKKSILKMYEKVRSKDNLESEVYFLGNAMSYIANKNIIIENDTVYGPSIDEVNHYLEKNSLDIFKKRLDSIIPLFQDLPNFELKVRKMKTRWGVCNQSSMTITLNSLLIHKDVTLIDYVIIHELCHFKYMDHSKNFWNEVKKYYPYYKLARKRLKQ